MHVLIECLAWGRRRFANPTRQWPSCSVSELTLDLAGHTLCGVPIGAPLSEACVFGPADRLVGASSEYDLLYYTLGLQVNRFEARIVGFRMLLDPASRAAYWERWCQPARLHVQMLDGSRHFLSRETREAAVFALLRRPMETGRVGHDRVHTFGVGGNVIDSYHEPESGRLVELTVGVSAP